MINEIVSNKWFWFVILGIILVIMNKLFFSKNKALIHLEREYVEVLKADKYKVKGQHD